MPFLFHKNKISLYSPVDGAWSQWGNWGDCSASCDQGVQQRQRLCTSPSPSGNGQPCNGSSAETRNCNMLDCSGTILYCYAKTHTHTHTHTRTQIVRERTIGSSRACALLTETTAGRCKNKQQTKSGRTHTYTKYRYLPSQHRKERQLEAIARGSSLVIIVLALVKRPTTQYFSELDLGSLNLKYCVQF